MSAALRLAVEQMTRERDSALAFIGGVREDLHQLRCTDWFPEGANNAALSMSENMRLIGNSCADFNPASVNSATLGPSTRSWYISPSPFPSPRAGVAVAEHSLRRKCSLSACIRVPGVEFWTRRRNGALGDETMNITNAESAHEWLAAWGGKPRAGILAGAIQGIAANVGMTANGRSPAMHADYIAALTVLRSAE